MEQQASDYLQRKEWVKAAELYNKLLLAKPNNKESVISYLQGRSQCFLELGQYEAVVADCRKIIKLLADSKDSVSSSATRARSQLVHALFALQRYSDAELATREWLSLSKSPEAPKLLERLHIAMHASQQKSLLENELSVFSAKLQADLKPEIPQAEPLPSCIYCNITCRDKSELRAHCQTETHQTVIMSDEGRDWHWRPPPRGMNADIYKQCKYWDEKQNCRFGTQCIEAHGTEELAEWKERYKYRQMKLQRAYEKELFGKSYTEQLLEKCMQASSPRTIMSDQIEYVDDGCNSSLVTTVFSKSSVKQWVFTLRTHRILHAIALLHDVHRNYFEISQVLCSINQGTIELDIKNNQEWVSVIKEEAFVSQYRVTVSFRTDIYGTFRQSVIFDFGYEPVLIKNLCVDVIPAEEAQKINEIRQEIALTSAERWTTSNSEIVSFTSPNVHYNAENESEKSFLKMYPCPQPDSLALSHATVSEKRLTRNNYRARMHELLYIEEMARNEQTNKFNLNAKLHVVKSYLLSSSSLASSTAKYSNFGELYAYINLSQDLSEDTLCGRLILSNCTTVLIGLDNKRELHNKRKVYEALIEDKGKNVIYLRLSAITVTELKLTPDVSFDVQVQFQLNRIPYCEWHYAVDKMPDLKLIFPDTYMEPLIPWSPQKQWCENVDNRLNLKQKEAVIAITTPSYVPLPPILIIGPFGTGKTFTLAQAIKQLLKQSETRILICTHSNSAADLYIKDYLHPYVEDGHEEARPLRIYYQKRWVVTVHPVVQEYCLIHENGGVRTFQPPTLEDVDKHRIVVVTLSTSIYLSNLGLPQGYFTHILLDEAAQTIECEAIMPLSFANQNTRIVLAGDHMQLSPELFSQFSKERNLHISLLERLYDHYPANFPCKILLCENYRAHEAIIEFTSESFYDQKLIASGRQPRHPLLYPLTFFTARGEDVQDINSTAFYNSSEAYEIVERVYELKRQWPKSWGKFDEHSIGIMTPYADQVFRIRTELRKRRLGSISVERVLNVQGKQFRAIFLSTVRTRRTCTSAESADNETDYGFLSNSKLLNTAITRAQSLVAVVGDPVALCSVGRCSKVWERFIQVCDKNSSLFGITWSLLKTQLDGLELKKTYGLNPLAPEFVPRKFKSEAYIKVPQISTHNGFPQPYIGYSIPRPSVNYYNPEPPVSTVSVIWPVYQPLPNYMWGLQPMQPVLQNSNDNKPLQTNELFIPQPPTQSVTPVFVPNMSSSSATSNRPTGVHNHLNVVVGNQKTSTPIPPPPPPPPPPPERDLIQFLDNVHIPQGVKDNSDTLHDLMNLLPDDMSLANVLMQPPAFHSQWFHYLLAKRGIEAAKKFEYLMLMSTKKERQGLLDDSNKRNADWEALCADMLKYNISNESQNTSDVKGPPFCDDSYLEQQTPDLNWFDKPINQINFDKPVYLKDTIHLDNTPNRPYDNESQNDMFRTNFTNGISLRFDKKESVPLYMRQSSLQNYQNQNGD